MTKLFDILFIILFAINSVLFKKQYNLKLIFQEVCYRIKPSSVVIIKHYPLNRIVLYMVINDYVPLFVNTFFPIYLRKLDI